MLARQRQELILDAVRTTGGARVSELVGTLGFSDMTVRRDIELLAQRGLATRVHGGATAVWSSVEKAANLAEAETNRARVAARRVAVVADNSNRGVVGLSTIAALGDVDVLVSDDQLEPEARAALVLAP